MSRAFCLNSLLPRSISTTLLLSSSLSADMVPRGESPAARTSAQKVHLKSSPAQDRITRLLHESAHALRVDAHEAAAPFANFPGDKDGLDVAGVHEIDDRSRRIVERPNIESIGAQDDDVGALCSAIMLMAGVPTLPSRLAQRAPSMVANSSTSRHVNSGGRF